MDDYIDYMDDYMKPFVKAKTAVFWNVDGCQIPDGDSAIDVSQRIRSALVEKNYLGTTTVYAYGDTKKIRNSLKSGEVLLNRINSVDDIKIEEMDYRGTAHIYANQNQTKDSPEIIFNHTPAGDKDVRLDKILIDLFCWVIDNPGPANLVIILEDVSKRHQFFPTISCLCPPSYNVLLAQPKDTPPDQLLGAVDEKYIWESLSSAGKFDIFPSDPSRSQNEDVFPSEPSSSENEDAFASEPSSSENEDVFPSVPLSSENEDVFPSVPSSSQLVDNNTSSVVMGNICVYLAGVGAAFVWGWLSQRSSH